MFDLQYHWYRITPLHLLLLPISLLFRALATLRRTLYLSRILTSKKLAVPVIVIGNISAGGTGKTPLTLALAQQLIRHGRHPLIVSRGHGGSAQQAQRVTPDSDVRQVGDEPLLMARRRLCPVWIGKDRAAAAQAALQANPQCDVVLCDDGLQHYRLRRDVEIAVIDGARGFGNGFMLPAGPLREPVSRLQTVDAVVVNVQARFPLPNPLPLEAPLSNSLPQAGERTNVKGNFQFWGEGANESLREFIFDGGDASTGQYAMRLSGDIFHNLLDPGKTATAAELRKLRCHAVAGIGHPQRYFRHLAALGLNIVEHAFPDHHPYRAADLSFADCDAILLTEKDAVKCSAFADERYW
ncbi:MAG: tetraacyldisaccharide 4'-kinase, partial [Gallionella sp.]|nr:tetraacyldisaccharide 4'-kinase [Gallionella sp.]